jgi:hypothetical protein
MVCVTLTAIAIVAMVVAAWLIGWRPKKSGYRPRRLTRAERLAKEAEEQRDEMKSHSTENLHPDKFQQLNRDLYGRNVGDPYGPP